MSVHETMVLFTAQQRKVLLLRHEKAALVCRRNGGEIVAHAHHAAQGSIPVSQTFTARVFSVLVFLCITLQARNFYAQNLLSISAHCRREGD